MPDPKYFDILVPDPKYLDILVPDPKYLDVLVPDPKYVIIKVGVLIIVEPHCSYLLTKEMRSRHILYIIYHLLYIIYNLFYIILYIIYYIWRSLIRSGNTFFEQVVGCFFQKL